MIEGKKDFLGRYYKRKHQEKTVDGDRKTIALCDGKEKHIDKGTL